MTEQKNQRAKGNSALEWDGPPPNRCCFNVCSPEDKSVAFAPPFCESDGVFVDERKKIKFYETGVFNMSTSGERTLKSARTEAEGSRVDSSRAESQTQWEKIAKTRWGKYITAIERHAILNAHSLFEKPTGALEVGCEGGRWTKLLDSLGWKMTSTDVNPKVLRMCQARVPRARCILVSSEEKTLPCETASLDLLLCIEVLPVAQSEWFVSEANRVLRPEGVLVVVLSNSFSVRGLAYRMFTAFDGSRRQFRNEYGVYTKSYRTWKKRFSKGGFEVVHEEGMCWLPFSRESNSVLIQPLTRLEQYVGLRRLTSLSPYVVLIARKD